MTYGEKPPAEILFAVRMMMVQYNLSNADMMKVLSAIDKENKNGMDSRKKDSGPDKQ